MRTSGQSKLGNCMQVLKFGIFCIFHHRCNRNGTVEFIVETMDLQAMGSEESENKTSNATDKKGGCSKLVIYNTLNCLTVEYLVWPGISGLFTTTVYNLAVRLYSYSVRRQVQYILLVYVMVSFLALTLHHLNRQNKLFFCMRTSVRD